MFKKSEKIINPKLCSINNLSTNDWRSFANAQDDIKRRSSAIWYQYFQKNLAFAAFILILPFLLITTSQVCLSNEVRVKDIAHIKGIRDNQLVGYGLVVGLQGTGDNSKSTLTTSKQLLTNLGTVIDNENNIKKGNSASVIVTATIGAFARSGDKLDITVSSLADAKSLEGGILIQTQLMAPNGEVIAVAQGPISTGGTSVSASGSSKRTGITTSGRIPNGAIVERDIYTEIGDDASVDFILNKSDFTLAVNVAQKVQEIVAPAKAIDSNTVRVYIPESFQDDRVAFIAAIENLKIQNSTGTAKVIINERTGTIVIGSEVKLQPAAVAHGGITVSISTKNEISQPNPLSNGVTTTTSNSEIEITKAPGNVVEIPSSSTLNDLVRALNTIGVTPHDLISILQALKSSGSLEATLEII